MMTLKSCFLLAVFCFSAAVESREYQPYYPDPDRDSDYDEYDNDSYEPPPSRYQNHYPVVPGGGYYPGGYNNYNRYGMPGFPMTIVTPPPPPERYVPSTVPILDFSGSKD